LKNSNLRYAIGFVVVASIFGIAYYASREHTPISKSEPIVWRSFDDGIALAGQTNKKLLVDVYTDWCSWCKKMDVEVYTNKDVARMLNERFVAVKLNAESSKPVTYKGRSFRESDLARELGVTGYPTTVFFDEHSDPITSLPGYSPAADFANILGFIGQDYYKSVTYQEYLSQTAPQR
jgi:thioredoxin-related protein